MKMMIGLFLIVVGMQSMTVPPPWAYKENGIEMARGEFTENGTAVKFAIVRVDPTKRSVYLEDTYKYLGASNPYSAFSLKEIQKKANAAVVSNAGSTKSYDVPSPAGLLEINHRIVRPIDVTSPGGGILCIARTKISIIPLSASTASCVDAVQRGPLLDSSFSSRTRNWKDRYRRTIAAVDEKGNLILFVTENEATLDGIATYLFVTRGDLKISQLLNLDGGGSTGLLFQPEGSPKSAFTLGNVDGLVASAISIR